MPIKIIGGEKPKVEEEIEVPVTEEKKEEKLIPPVKQK